MLTEKLKSEGWKFFQLSGRYQIFTTHELRQKICEKLEVPESDVEGYVAHYEVLDEEEDKEPRFTVIWTSKKLLARARSYFHQDDATYRLTWQVRNVLLI